MLRLLLVFTALFFFLSPSLTFAASVTLSPSQDTYVDMIHPDRNYAGSSDLRLFYFREVAKASYVLIKFPLQNIPANSHIRRATLNLYLKSGEGLSPVSTAFVDLQQDWNNNVTFNNRPRSGGSFTQYKDVDNNSGNKIWSLSGHVQDIVDGDEPNNGFMLMDTVGIGNQTFDRIFASSEDGVAAHRPTLVVEYDPPVAGQANNNDQGQAMGEAGNAAAGRFNLPDLNIPGIVPGVGNLFLISNVKAENVSKTGVTIKWTSSKAGTSWVFYGNASDGSDRFDKQTGQNDSTGNHSINLANLEQGTKYSFKVMTKDANNKQAFGNISYFTTLANPQDAASPTPTPSASSNALSDIESKLENKVADLAIDSALTEGDIANEPPQESSESSTSALTPKGPISQVAGVVGINQLAGILMIILALMFFIGALILYKISRKVHHHIRAHLETASQKAKKKK